MFRLLSVTFESIDLIQPNLQHMLFIHRETIVERMKGWELEKICFVQQLNNSVQILNTYS